MTNQNARGRCRKSVNARKNSLTRSANPQGGSALVGRESFKFVRLRRNAEHVENESAHKSRVFQPPTSSRRSTMPCPHIGSQKQRVMIRFGRPKLDDPAPPITGVSQSPPQNATGHERYAVSQDRRLVASFCYDKSVLLLVIANCQTVQSCSNARSFQTESRSNPGSYQAYP